MTKLTTWIALAATAALLAGLGVWLVEWRAGQPAGAPAGAEPDTGQGVIEQALRQIPGEVDSTELKSRWTDDARGVRQVGGQGAAHRGGMGVHARGVSGLRPHLPGEPPARREPARLGALGADLERPGAQGAPGPAGLSGVPLFPRVAAPRRRLTLRGSGG